MTCAEIIREIIQNSKRKRSQHYWSDIFNRAEVETDQQVKNQLIALGRFCSISLNPNDENNPYGPIWKNFQDGTRSADVDDFSDEEYEKLETLIEEIQAPELKGKLCDLAYIRKKSIPHAIKALNAYADAFKEIMAEEGVYEAAPLLKRALNLVRRLNQYDPVGKSIEEFVVHALDGSVQGLKSEKFLNVDLIRPFLDIRQANHAKFATICEEIAILESKTGNFFVENAFWMLAADFHKKAKDDLNFRRCLQSGAQVFERAASVQQHPFQSVNLYNRAIEIYRTINGFKDKVDELHRKLLEAQKDAPNYLGRIQSPPIDISDEIRVAKDYVKKDTFLEAILSLSRIIRPPSYEELKEEVKKSIRDYPLLHLFHKSVINEKGRVVAKADPAMRGPSIPNDEDPGVWEAVVEKAGFSHTINTQSFIIPAIQQVYDDHYFNSDDLLPILKANPFVESGHEEIISKSIVFGLNFQWLESMHLLVPQIENSFRYFLESNGVIVSKLDDDGIQENRTLNFLLDHPKLTELLGEDLVKDFKSLLVEKTGPNIRNLLSHGLMKAERFYSYQVVYLWWLSLFYFFLPVEIKSRGDETTGSEK